jgi:hypothetical protein
MPFMLHGLPPPFARSWSLCLTLLCVRGLDSLRTAARAIVFALPQGPSLRSGLFCPDPSTLIRPRPSHRQAHRDFVAKRLIRNAFAVRERLGDPPVVPSFCVLFCVDMSSATTPESSRTVLNPVHRSESLAFNHPLRFRHSQRSHNPLPVGLIFRGFWFASATTCRLARLPGGSDLALSPSRRRLLHPSFRRVGFPSRRRV